MGQTNISIRIDEDLKTDAEALFAKLGLTLSSATNIFFRQAVMRQMIPFSLVVKEPDQRMRARKEFGEAFKTVQNNSIANSTDSMSLENINDIIKECREETSVK